MHLPILMLHLFFNHTFPTCLKYWDRRQSNLEETQLCLTRLFLLSYLHIPLFCHQRPFNGVSSASSLLIYLSNTYSFFLYIYLFQSHYTVQVALHWSVNDWGFLFCFLYTLHCVLSLLSSGAQLSSMTTFSGIALDSTLISLRRI